MAKQSSRGRRRGSGGWRIPAAPHEVEVRVVLAFFDQLDAFLAETQPSGRVLAPADEALLAHYCFVLSLFESKYRSGVTADALILPGDQQSVEGLLALAPDAAIGDITAMAALFFARYGDLIQKPVILNPKFAGSGDVGVADADLIIDGTLFEIKTSKHNMLKPDWFRQLVAYWLLDYNDELHINGFGIYMPRQGLLMTWPLEEFLTTLSGYAAPIDRSALRAEFRAVAETVRPPEPPPKFRSKSGGAWPKSDVRSSNEQKRREARLRRRAAAEPKH